MFIQWIPQKLFVSVAAALVLVALPLGARAANLVTVNTDPDGIAFDLIGPANTVYPGVSPGAFKDLPTGEYRVQFGYVEGCATPKPQLRDIFPGANVHFIGRYLCGTLKPPTPEPPVSLEGLPGHVSMWLKAHQTEIMPGGTAVFTLGIRNHSKTTQHDLVASFEFDQMYMNIREELPGNGTVQGDTALWHIPELFAGQTWTVHIPVHVLESLREGTTVRSTGRVAGDEIDRSISLNLSDTATVGSPILPPTGTHVAISLFLLVSTLLLASATLATRRLSTARA